MLQRPAMPAFYTSGTSISSVNHFSLVLPLPNAAHSQHFCQYNRPLRTRCSASDEAISFQASVPNTWTGMSFRLRCNRIPEALNAVPDLP